MNFHRLANVYIRGADDEIMHGHGREFYLVALSIIRQIYISSELLRHEEALAAELDICLLIGLVDIVAFATFAVAGSYGGMMRHLLC